MSNKVGRPSKKEEIHEWRLHNPEKRKIDCARDLHLSYFTVDKHWTISEIKDDKRSCYEIIQDWRGKNPDKGKKECVLETKLSRRSVYYNWEKKGEDKVIVDQKGQLYFDF